MTIINIIIFLSVFILVLWLQNNDDLKQGITRTTLYDKVKIPIVSALIVIIIKDFNYKDFNYKDFNYNNCMTMFKSVETIEIIPNNNNVLNAIYTGPPDF
jgi:hypothetical protein